MNIEDVKLALGRIEAKLDAVLPRLLLVEDQIIRWRKRDKYFAAFALSVVTSLVVWKVTGK